MKQVAVYGKGGIGKSTASANISYILSKSGMKVAQIGCDPKHDSTRLLLKGKTQKTVLDCLNSKEDLRGEIAVTGKNGIVCMETGGPEPGVGCAGRGILTAFDYIKSHSLISEDTDIVLYDVLGDVVCGGFAVPLRKQYANIVFIVTSGEFMSLYAANNVLKGIRNFDSGDKRLAGLILNCRGNDREYEYVKNFADAVGLPIVAVIPRSGRFSAAESEGVTVCEMFPDSEEAASYNSIAEILKNPDPVLYAASPLGDDDLDLVAKGIRVVSGKTGQTVRKLEVTERSALRSCGIRAAAHCCMEILDAEIVAHGPMSCAYMYENGYDRNLLNEGNTWIPSISDRLFSSNLDDRASIFGGGKDLAALLEERISKGAKLIFVLPACVPGIIGDDTENIADTVQSRHPGVRIITIPVDGILCGGAVQGRDMAYERICGLADKTVSPRPDMVNIIGYYDSDDRILTACDDTERILGKLGFGVSCRFLHHNTSSDIAGLRRGSVNLMYSRGVPLRRGCAVIERCAGIGYYEKPLPRGLEQTVSWIKDFSDYMNADKESAEMLCRELENEYREKMEPLKSSLDGVTAIVYAESSADINWLLETLCALGIQVPEILCPTNSIWNEADEVLEITRDIRIKYDMNLDDLRTELDSLKPTFFAGSSSVLSTVDYRHMILERPRPGISGCIEHAKRIVRMCRVTDYDFS